MYSAPTKRTRPLFQIHTKSTVDFLGALYSFKNFGGHPKPANEGRLKSGQRN
jgi:hypothetical protein